MEPQQISACKIFGENPAEAFGDAGVGKGQAKSHDRVGRMADAARVEPVTPTMST